MNEITLHDESNFDYGQLDELTAKQLQEKEKNMATIVGNAYTELGKELLEAQNLLSNHYNGVFTEWFEGLGIKKQTAYNMINRYKLVVQNLDNRETIEDLPLSLAYEVSKPSAKPEAREKVLSGEITSHKEYKTLERKLKESEQAKQQAEQQAEAARQSERIATSQLAEMENREPEVVEKVVEKLPDKIRRELDEKNERLRVLTNSHKDLSQELQSYQLKDTDDFNEEKEERERKRLWFEAEKNTLQIKIHTDDFLEKVSMNAFRKGAIASSDNQTRKKLQDSVEALEAFTQEIKAALNGRTQL